MVTWRSPMGTVATPLGLVYLATVQQSTSVRHTHNDGTTTTDSTATIAQEGDTSFKLNVTICYIIGELYISSRGNAQCSTMVWKASRQGNAIQPPERCYNAVSTFQRGQSEDHRVDDHCQLNGPIQRQYSATINILPAMAKMDVAVKGTIRTILVQDNWHNPGLQRKSWGQCPQELEDA
eukprot:260191-Amphidinium_carterae.2